MDEKMPQNFNSLIKGIEAVNEYQTNIQPDSSELKVEINNLLFVNLPDKVTLGEMEKMALTIHQMIMNKWEN